MDKQHFEDLAIHLQDSSSATISLYSGLCKQFRTQQTEWIFERGPLVNSDRIKIHVKGPEGLRESTRGTVITKMSKNIVLCISSKQMPYRSGQYYFEFRVQECGLYSNFLVGVCFRSIDGEHRKEYDPEVHNYVGSKSSQFGIYLDGIVWNSSRQHSDMGSLRINKNENIIGVFVDTFTMQMAFLNSESSTGYIDLKKHFPIDEHPLIYRDKLVVLSPAVSLDNDGDKCTLISNVKMPREI